MSPQRELSHRLLRIRINYVCVYHRGTQISVTEHLLSKANIFGLAVELGGKGVSQHIVNDPTQALKTSTKNIIESDYMGLTIQSEQTPIIRC